MEGTGPESKRPRHHYELSHRMPPQQQNVPISTSHNNPNILPAPATYPSAPQQAPPPSPFHDVTHESRSLPDPHSYVQQHPHSGHTTPRDGRFQPELTFPRRESTSGTPRSPDDHAHFPQSRKMSIVTTGDGQHYPPQYSVDPQGPIAAFPPDPHMNGTMHHGLPIHGPDPATHPMVQGYGPEYNPSPVTAGPHPYAGMHYGPPPMGQAGLRPKKGNRAQQACDVCRTRKAKCDEGRPRCGFCVENDMECHYQSVAPAKIDRANQAILDQLETQNKDIKSMREEFVSQLEQVKEMILSKDSGLRRHSDSVPEEDTKPVIASQEQSVSPAILNQKPLVLPSSGSRDAKVVDASPSGSFNTNATESSGNDVVPSIAKQNAIHIEHNTAAQKLFRWPSVKVLLVHCRGLNYTEGYENYFFDLELAKGVLRLYGRGQGPDPGGGTALLFVGAASPAISSKSGPSDEVSETSSPTSTPEYLWGYGFNPMIGESGQENVTGGLNADNTLKLDARTITMLHESYVQNMHVMHPIIDEPSMNRMLEQFKRRYCPQSELASSKSPFAIPVANVNLDAIRDASSTYNKTLKRKHSDAQHLFSGIDANHIQDFSNSRPVLERSPTTAIVLLILALGKICLHREALPGPFQVNSRESTNNRSYASPMASQKDSPPSYPIRHSPSSSSYSSAQSPVGMLRPNHSSPRSSVADTTPYPRNLDIIPGLAYYAQATDILGNMTGSHDIAYVQCCLLAGLYAGQLADSIVSLSWIQCAAKACRILVRDSSLRHIPKSRQDAIRIAFYTASQLESDICAELDFPTSGIQDIEGVAYPAGYVAEDAPPSQDGMSKDRIMQFYSYQLHLRKILNLSQKGIYAPDMDLTETKKMTPLRNIFDDWINQWRENLKEDLKWSDGDPPLNDINHARLRGKYYGAQYIIHRPFLHYALELDSNGGLDHYMDKNAEVRPGSMRPPKTASDPHLDEVLKSAIITIKAARLSTEAFDGVWDRKRLIVTNIVGTAHAQFGNMLVLSAVYKSKHLKAFISDNPKQTMEHLFKRTINFLGSLRPISPTLGHDRYILKCLREVVFEGESDITPTISTSFE